MVLMGGTLWMRGRSLYSLIMAEASMTLSNSSRTLFRSDLFAPGTFSSNAGEGYRGVVVSILGGGHHCAKFSCTDTSESPSIVFGTDKDVSAEVTTFRTCENDRARHGARDNFDAIKHEETVLGRLRRLVECGKLRADPAQTRAARRLSSLQRALRHYDANAIKKYVTACLQEEMQKEEKKEEARDSRLVGATNFAFCCASTSNAITGSRPGEIVRNGTKSKQEIPSVIGSTSNHSATTATPKHKTVALASTSTFPVAPPARYLRGLYLYGGVGTGKSMLMDAFYETLPSSIMRVGTQQERRRVHFHSFMLEVHSRIHDLKKSDMSSRGRDFHVDTTRHRNPIVRVGKQIAEETNVLCFDEFQVTDIADAMIIKQLFEVLFQMGTVVVATSNRRPKDLYQNGLNRGYFLPFIDLLEKHCIIHDMSSEVDHRQFFLSSLESKNEWNGDFFFVTEDVGEKAEEKMLARVLRHLALNSNANGGSHDLLEGAEIPVGFNRSLRLTRGKTTTFAEGLCLLHFDDLCKADLGAADYRALARRFPVVALDGIPLLSKKRHDEARRFIILIDELYEARCLLACTSLAPVWNLFYQDTNRSDALEDCGRVEEQEQNGRMLGIDVSSGHDGQIMPGEHASVSELLFALRRASSRIVEMCSRDTWEKRMDRELLRAKWPDGDKH